MKPGGRRGCGGESETAIVKFRAFAHAKVSGTFRYLSTHCPRLCYLEWVQGEFAGQRGWWDELTARRWMRGVAARRVARGRGSDCFEGYQLLESGEVRRISRVQGKPVRRGGRGDQQVGEARPSGPPGRARCGELFCRTSARLPHRRAAGPRWQPPIAAGPAAVHALPYRLSHGAPRSQL